MATPVHHYRGAQVSDPPVQKTERIAFWQQIEEIRIYKAKVFWYFINVLGDKNDERMNFSRILVIADFSFLRFLV